MSRIFLYHGDITNIPTGAIVNPANTSLLGGSGVDGLIHRKGGEIILEECMKIRSSQGGCKIGEAVITSAGNLPADYVIHTVGPVWEGGGKNEEKLLRNSYLSSLILAEEYNIKEISFPCISTGRYKFPKNKASHIAIKTIKGFLEHNRTLNKINFVCYDNVDYELYKKEIEDTEY